MKKKSIVDPLLKMEKIIEHHLDGGWREYQINQKRQKHGWSKTFYKYANLSWQTEYKNNQRHGLYKDKWNNGLFCYVDTNKKNQTFGLRIEFSNKQKK